MEEEVHTEKEFEHLFLLANKKINCGCSGKTKLFNLSLKFIINDEMLNL